MLSWPDVWMQRVPQLAVFNISALKAGEMGINIKEIVSSSSPFEDIPTDPYEVPEKVVSDCYLNMFCYKNYTPPE